MLQSITLPWTGCFQLFPFCIKLKNMKYKFEDINIGDEVIFDSTPSQSNHDLYWKVIDKIDQTKELIIQLDEMGYKDLRWTLRMNEVKIHMPIKQ